MARGVADLEEELPPLGTEESEEQEAEPLSPPSPRAPRNPRAGRSSTRSAASRSARTPRSPSGPSSAKLSGLEEIRTGVEDMFTTTGMFTSPFLPVTGAVLVARAGKSADTVVRLCEQDTRVYRAMLRFIKWNTYFEAATVIGVLTVAVSVDLGQMQPDGFIPTKLIGKEIAIVRADATSAEAAHQNGVGVSEPQWAPGAPSVLG